MHLFAALLMLATPFWEAKDPRAWSDQELLRVMTDSPWAQVTEFRSGSPMPIYLASAKPARDAEIEWMRRYTLKAGIPPATQMPASREYELFMQENLGKVIVVGVRNSNFQALSSREETRRMEDESFLRVGKNKIRMTGHFPPADSDPVLRFVFPRPAEFGKELNFELYIPGVTAPYRQAVFKVRDLLYKGQLEL